MPGHQKAKKKNLMASGLRLYLRDGYENTTIDDIVNDVGVAKGTFYLYFPSKNEYLCELYSWTLNEAYDKLENIFTEEMPAWEKLGRFLDDFIRMLEENRDLIRMFHKIAKSVDLVRLNYEVGKRMLEPLSEIIGQGVEEGVMESDDPWATAFMLKSMLEGVLHTVIVLDLKVPLEYLSERFTLVIRRALTPCG